MPLQSTRNTISLGNTLKLLLALQFILNSAIASRIGGYSEPNDLRPGSDVYDNFATTLFQSNVR